MGERKRKVILVDDEKMVVESMSSIVDWESEGFILSATCLNGFQALDAIREFSPDIVITDIRMPVMDGIELIRKTREFDSQVIFIILSGYGEFELAQKAMKEGVREFLLKPCGEEEILEALKNSCRDRAQKEPAEYEKNDEEESLENRDFVEVIMNYVQTHYFEESLNLKWIAKELVFLNEDYIGRRFHQKTGTRFTAYLNGVRIRKVKEYMKTHRDAGNERLASAVGFGNNPKYFEKVFKKYTGCTPREYKEKEIRALDLTK